MPTGAERLCEKRSRGKESIAGGNWSQDQDETREMVVGKYVTPVSERRGDGRLTHFSLSSLSSREFIQRALGYARDSGRTGLGPQILHTSGPR